MKRRVDKINSAFDQLLQTLPKKQFFNAPKCFPVNLSSTDSSDNFESPVPKKSEGLFLFCTPPTEDDGEQFYSSDLLPSKLSNKRRKTQLKPRKIKTVNKRKEVKSHKPTYTNNRVQVDADQPLAQRKKRQALASKDPNSLAYKPADKNKIVVQKCLNHSPIKKHTNTLVIHGDVDSVDLFPFVDEYSSKVQDSAVSNHVEEIKMKPQRHVQQVSTSSSRFKNVRDSLEPLFSMYSTSTPITQKPKRKESKLSWEFKRSRSILNSSCKILTELERKKKGQRSEFIINNSSFTDNNCVNISCDLFRSTSYNNNKSSVQCISEINLNKQTLPNCSSDQLISQNKQDMNKQALQCRVELTRCSFSDLAKLSAVHESKNILVKRRKFKSKAIVDDDKPKATSPGTSRKISSHVKSGKNKIRKIPRSVSENSVEPTSRILNSSVGKFRQTLLDVFFSSKSEVSGITDGQLHSARASSIHPFCTPPPTEDDGNSFQSTDSLPDKLNGKETKEKVKPRKKKAGDQQKRNGFKKLAAIKKRRQKPRTGNVDQVENIQVKAPKPLPRGSKRQPLALKDTNPLPNKPSVNKEIDDIQKFNENSLFEHYTVSPIISITESLSKLVISSEFESENCFSVLESHNLIRQEKPFASYVTSTPVIPKPEKSILKRSSIFQSNVSTIQANGSRLSKDFKMSRNVLSSACKHLVKLEKKVLGNIPQVLLRKRFFNNITVRKKRIVQSSGDLKCSNASGGFHKLSKSVMPNCCNCQNTAEGSPISSSDIEVRDERIFHCRVELTALSESELIKYGQTDNLSYLLIGNKSAETSKKPRRKLKEEKFANGKKPESADQKSPVKNSFPQKGKRKKRPRSSSKADKLIDAQSPIPKTSEGQLRQTSLDMFFFSRPEISGFSVDEKNLDKSRPEDRIHQPVHQKIKKMLSPNASTMKRRTSLHNLAESSTHSIIDCFLDLSVCGSTTSRKPPTKQGHLEAKLGEAPTKCDVWLHLSNYQPKVMLTRLDDSLYRTSLLGTLTAKTKVFCLCDQTECLSFNCVLPNKILETAKKIGEGSYGEVFSMVEPDGTKIAVKIIPVEGDQEVNGGPQMTFKDVLSEVILSKKLNDLSYGKAYQTTNFITLHRVSCVKGKYPKKLLSEWNEFETLRGTENDNPCIFKSEQLYIIFQFSFGGMDLEILEIKSEGEAESIFAQVACSLAAAEGALEFEHRDLHWGNILVSPSCEPVVRYAINGCPITLESSGVSVALIDFTLSRMATDGATVYNDLSKDMAIFQGKGDIQFDVYREMKKHTKNSWEGFYPYTNVLWLDYLVKKLLGRLNCSKNRVKSLRLTNWKRVIKRYKSVTDFVLQVICQDR